MHKDQYLSIGEVSKLTRVNIKSLRYYDRIGVLTPAYTDPDSGYRYYLPSQLGYLDAIRFCIDVGIPLREFSKYSENGTINAALLMKNASAIAHEKMRMIQEGLRFIQRMQALLERNERLIAAEGAIEYSLNERTYVVEPMERFDLTFFNRSLSRLQLAALKNNYHMGYDFGQMMIWRDGSNEPERYAYTEVIGAGLPMDNLLYLPETNYTAIHIQTTRIADAPVLFPELFLQAGDKIVLQTEVISSVFDTNSHTYELRCAVLPPQA